MRKLLFFAAAAVALAAQVSFAATEIDRIVAVVGQQAVTLSELQTEMAPALNELEQRLRGEELAAAKEKLRKNTLNNLIDKYVQLQEAKAQGVEVAEDEVDAAIKDIMEKNMMSETSFARALGGEGFTLDDYRKSIRDQIMVLRLVTRAVRSKVSLTEAEIEDYYNKNGAKFASKEMVRIASIAFPAGRDGMEAARAKAEEARKQILAGTPFEEMAAKCTGDPGAAKSCVLGDFTRGELAPAVEEKAFAMASGEVSEPLEGPNGYQLIKVTERTVPGLMPLEAVRNRVVDELNKSKAETLFAKWIQELRGRTYVEVRDSSF